MFAPLLPSSLKAFVCVSGKRKSGKDFLTLKLASALANHFPDFDVSICSLSNPLKDEFACLRGIDAARLKGDGPEKERVRKEMIEFGENLRAEDSAYFCRKAFAQRLTIHKSADDSSNAEIVLVSDCRRPSDIAFFRRLFPTSVVLHLRVLCSLPTRQKRGFIFRSGVDDAESECALDEAEWDIVVENEEEEEKNGGKELERRIGEIVTELGTRMKNDTKKSE
ncbi:hypothetical protein niasHS_010810 [Heterodera schachtii]|uniref:Phosphomevalonate kinase n=1 Tax=Heterodera schachtii TaxID=97005 RepID=A0ABD2ITT3_HETSC